MAEGGSIREREVPLARQTDAAPAGEPDPRGWPLLSADGFWMGRVRSAFVSPESRVRLLDCELDADALDLHDDRRILIPAEAARLDAGSARVVADRSRDDLLRLPHLPAGDEPPPVRPAQRRWPPPRRSAERERGPASIYDLRGRGTGDI